MTIEKGRPWGIEATRPADLRILGSDWELADAVSSGDGGPIGVSGGDLHRSLGSPPDRAAMQRLPIDVLEVSADDATFLAVAHVVARRGWWRGQIVAACNVERIGEWEVAPRAHPNDGRFDVIEVDPSMTIRERWHARQRLPAAMHVPHPRIATRTARTRAWEFDRPHAIWVDGRHVADASRLQVVVRPDAFELLV
ncbi:MAG: hypothetical protein ABIP17_14805 [Ilumatobacteraceae bacterium]